MHSSLWTKRRLAHKRLKRNPNPNIDDAMNTTAPALSHTAIGIEVEVEVVAARRPGNTISKSLKHYGSMARETLMTVGVMKNQNPRRPKTNVQTNLSFRSPLRNG
jgi:hypothetical protein